MAQELAKSLASQGIEAWVDTEIPAGSRWPDAIRAALDAADAFVLAVAHLSDATVACPEILARLADDLIASVQGVGCADAPTATT